MADLPKLLEEYNALVARSRAGTLSGADAERLALIEDVLLELGAIGETHTTHAPARPVRAEMVLEVTFGSASDVVKTYSENIGQGGIAVKAPRTLPPGSVVELRVKLPDGSPLLTTGTVAWTREGVMGVAFASLKPEDERRLKSQLVQSASVLKKIQSALNADIDTTMLKKVGAALNTDLRELGAKKGPEPVSATEVDTSPRVYLALQDAALAQVTAELLAQGKIRAVNSRGAEVPLLVIADTMNAYDAQAANPGRPLILVNASGPDALMGKLATLRPAAYVRRPATGAAILVAVRTQLERLAGSKRG